MRKAVFRMLKSHERLQSTSNRGALCIKTGNESNVTDDRDARLCFGLEKNSLIIESLSNLCVVSRWLMMFVLCMSFVCGKID